MEKAASVLSIFKGQRDENDNNESEVKEKLFPSSEKIYITSTTTKNGKDTTQDFNDDEEEIQSRKHFKNPLLSLADSLFSLIIVSPMMVGCWRGTWMLFDFYREKFAVYQIFCFSIFGHIIFAVMQEEIAILLHPNNDIKWRVYFLKILRRVYFYVFLMISVGHWWCGWYFFDTFTQLQSDPKTLMPIASTAVPAYSFTGLSLLCLMCMRVLRNTLASPFGVSLDSKEFAFKFPLHFKTEASDKTSLYILDCLFSVLIVGTLVVFVWRGAWVLLDIFVYPDDFTLSSWVSLIGGYTVCILVFIVQPFVRKLCDKITGASRLLATDVFLIFSLIGTVNVWRGIWNILNIYLLPENQELSCWITHWVCLIILILLGCSNTLLVRGVYIDAEEPAGKCVVLPCHYLRIILQREKMEAIKEQTKADAIEKRKKELDNARPFENHVITIEKLANMSHKEQNFELGLNNKNDVPV